MSSITPDIQALADQKYKNGMLASTVQSIEKQTEKNTEKIEALENTVNRFIGSINTLKWITSVFGIGTIAQIIITISKIGG